MTAVTVIFLILLVVIIGGGIFLCRRVILPPCHTIEEGLNLEFGSGSLDREFYEGLHKKSFSYKNEKGQALSGEWLLCGQKTQKVMIICHGFGWNRSSSYKYAGLFLQRGYDVLVYDHVHCGRSEGKYTSMGWQESRDLKGIVTCVQEEYGKDCSIATMGESMGAVTVLLHMAEDERVKFVIADCPFASLTQQLSYRLKVEYHLPPFPLVPVTSLICRLWAGFSFAWVHPAKAIENSRIAEGTPLLLIHGLEDTYIPCEASGRIESAKGQNVMLYMCPGAEHARSYVTDVRTYDDIIGKFLTEMRIQ